MMGDRRNDGSCLLLGQVPARPFCRGAGTGAEKEPSVCCCSKNHPVWGEAARWAGRVCTRSLSWRRAR